MGDGRKVGSTALVVVLAAVCVCVVGALPAWAEDDVYSARRMALMEKCEDGVAVFMSAPVYLRNGDSDFEFRQESNFLYLSGFEEPQSYMVLAPGADAEFVMLVRPHHPVAEMWTGARAGEDGAVAEYGADAAYDVEKMSEVMLAALECRSKIYCNPQDERLQEVLNKAIEELGPEREIELVDVRPIVHEMRAIKDAQEIAYLRRACDLTCDALIEVLKASKPGMGEYEYEALIEYTFRRGGARGPGYPSIVASGANATVLHYIVNNRVAEDGDLLLMDVGAEVENYTADVTRTYPINGRFSEAQREIYEVVLQTIKRATAIAGPGVGLNEIDAEGRAAVAEGLTRLGLITDPESKWQVGIWLPYHISHWIGLDVHDVGDLGRRSEKGRILKPGMVFTIEPGVYVGEDVFEMIRMMTGRFASEEEIEAYIEAIRPAVERYSGIGVRIEDDVLITEDGYEVLSARAPMEIEEIERIMKEAKQE